MGLNAAQPWHFRGYAVSPSGRADKCGFNCGFLVHMQAWPPFRAEGPGVFAIVLVELATCMPLLAFGQPAGHDGIARAS